MMAVRQSGELKIWQRRERGRQFAIWGGWLVAVAVFAYCWRLISDRTIWMFVTDAPRQAADMAERMVPPKWEYMNSLWAPLWDTLNIATLGTVMAVIIAFPIAFCAARNTTPSVVFVRPVALFIIVSSRSINSLVWALMLVTIIGPGVVAGILAIGFRSIGFCAKLLYEAIEEIDETQVEADRPRPGRRRRDRPATGRLHLDPRLDPGLGDPARHTRDRDRQRVGIGEGPSRHHLIEIRRLPALAGRDHSQSARRRSRSQRARLRDHDSAQRQRGPKPRGPVPPWAVSVNAAPAKW